MKYDHIVKIGGAFYPAGVDVPEEIIQESSVEDVLNDNNILFETDPVIRKKGPGRPRQK